MYLKLLLRIKWLRICVNGTDKWKVWGQSSSTIVNIWSRDFPGGAVVKNPPANAGDMGSSPGPGRSHMPQSN